MTKSVKPHQTRKGSSSSPRAKKNTRSKRLITVADYTSDEYQNIRVPANTSQESLDLLYNKNVPYEARIFQSRSTHAPADLDMATRSLNEDETWLLQERTRHKILPWYKRPSMYMICVVILLFTFSHGVSISSKLQLMINVICKDVTSDGINNGKCNTNATVQLKISKLESIMTAAGNIIATLLSGRICELSDRYGRKAIISMVAGTLLISKVLVLILIHPLMNTYHPVLIVLAASIESVGGGTITLMALSNAYVSDVVEQKDRILKMGIMSGCLFGGLGVGPFLGSLIIKTYQSNLTACFVDIFVVLVLLVFCVFIFPESRSQTARLKSVSTYLLQREIVNLSTNGEKSWRKVLSDHLMHFFQPLKMLSVPEEIESLPNSKYTKKAQLFILISIMSFFSLGAVFMGRVFILYPTYVFKWNSENVGYFITLMMVSRAVVLFVLSPNLLKYLKGKYATSSTKIDAVDLIVLRTSLILEFVGSVLLTIARSSKLYNMSQLVTCFGAMLNPSIDSMMIKYSPIDKVGQMMGAVSMVKNLLAAIIPSLLLMIYSTTIGCNPKFVLYVMLSLLVIGNLLAWVLHEEKEVDDNSSTERREESGYGSV